MSERVTGGEPSAVRWVRDGLAQLLTRGAAVLRPAPRPQAAEQPQEPHQVRAQERAQAMQHPRAVPGTQGVLRPNQWLPKDEQQQQILRSRDALYGRTTYYAGEMTSNLLTYPGSGLSPGKISSIHVEVDSVGRVLPKADMDQQVLRCDGHLEAVDGARRTAVTSKKLLWKAANSSPLALRLCALAEALVDDCDGFDSTCYRLLNANGSGFAAEEAVFEDKTLHLGDGLEVPGTWPQQTAFIHNRCFRFDPIEDRPMLQQAGGRWVDPHDPPYKILFHEGVGDGAVRQRGHQYRTVWMHMIKHDGIARLAQCLDWYGIPHPYAEMDPEQFQNEELKNETLAAMADFGSGTPYIKNKEIPWGFTETPTGLDARGMHAALVGLCNTEMSKAVQSETLTTEMGGVGSYNASETHEAVKADRVGMDERALAATVRRWLRAVFRLNLALLVKIFNASPQQILGCVPKPYWLIHRAAAPDKRLDMQLKAVEAGLAIDEDQIYDEHGFRKPGPTGRALRGTAQIIPDGAKTAGAHEAAKGVDNPKDLPPAAASQSTTAASAPGAAESSAAAAPQIELTSTDLGTIVTVNEARASKNLTPLPGADGELTIAEFKAKNSSVVAEAANAEAGNANGTERTPPQ